MSRLFKKYEPLYLITDTALAGISHSRIVRHALAAGIRLIQLREKHMTKRELYREALAIRALTGRHKAVFIINDHIDVALAVNADGVHLGQEDMPVEDARRIMGRKKIIGVSTHSLKQAVRAEQAGADYIGFGPMFETSTKDAGSPKGLRRLREVRRHVTIPVVAIGGITSEKVSSVLEAGADASAVMSAFLKGDIGGNVKEFLAALDLKRRHVVNRPKLAYYKRSKS